MLTQTIYFEIITNKIFIKNKPYLLVFFISVDNVLSHLFMTWLLIQIYDFIA